MNRYHFSTLFAAGPLGLVLLALSAAGQSTSPATAPASSPRATPAVAHDRVVVDAKTEASIKGALKYLAAKQKPNGAWVSPNDAHPVAVTGYAIMAFLAAGQLPDQGEYGKNVRMGVEFLLSQARTDGNISSSDNVLAGKQISSMYDHGIASIALGEVYGQTPDPKVREVVANSVKLIVGCQNSEGGWRYTPRPESADISVTVLQLVALRVAKNGGIAVPQSTIDRAIQYVKNCYDRPSGGFTYMAFGEAVGGSRTNTAVYGHGFARTAAAIYSLQICGDYDDPLIASGSKYLLDNYANDRQWYTYGNFYAAPAQYMVGGAVWEKWYTLLKTELLGKVITQGGDKTIAYWDGIDANGRDIGTSYCTAIYTMILAMPYHYIPLYQR